MLRRDHAISLCRQNHVAVVLFSTSFKTKLVVSTTSFQEYTEIMSKNEEKRELFIWKKVYEEYLVQEVLAVKPYQYRTGTKEKGAAWTKIAESLAERGLKVTQRSVREKLEKLLKEFKKREAVEMRASGIEGEEFGELERGLMEIKERMAEIEEARTCEDQTQKKEKATAEEMRKIATEKLAETKKRRAASEMNDEDEGSPTTPNGKRRARSSTNTMLEAVKESIELKRKAQESSEELRKKEIEARMLELQQQRAFQQQLIQQQQLYQQQQAFNMHMMGALSELVKFLKK